MRLRSLGAEARLPSVRRRPEFLRRRFCWEHAAALPRLVLMPCWPHVNPPSNGRTARVALSKSYECHIVKRSSAATIDPKKLIPNTMLLHQFPTLTAMDDTAAGGKMVDMSEFVRNNAGKAFEFMLEVVEEDRKAAGLPDIATARAEAAEDPKVSVTYIR